MRGARLARYICATWQRIPDLADLPNALDRRTVRRQQGGIGGSSDDARRTPSAHVWRRPDAGKGHQWPRAQDAGRGGNHD